MNGLTLSMQLLPQVRKVQKKAGKTSGFTLFTDAHTSGTMAIFDLDGDGHMELISAGYSAGTVYVHTFKK